jgi:hypothetical protein
LDLRQQREVSTGFGDGLSQAFELVMTPALFGAAGFFIDRWLGTTLVFTLGLVALVLGYEVWKLVVVYGTDIDKAQAHKPWMHSKARSAARSQVTGTPAEVGKP